MLEDAIKLSKEGKAVYVIAPHMNYADLLRRQLLEMAGTKLHGIKVEIPDEVRNMNWKTMQLERAHPNCVVLVDHYTIETLFAPLIEMHTRYDYPANVEEHGLRGSEPALPPKNDE